VPEFALFRVGGAEYFYFIFRFFTTKRTPYIIASTAAIEQGRSMAIRMAFSFS